MQTKKVSWENIVALIMEDAETMDYVVGFLDQANSIDGTCYVYFKDDDTSSIYALNDQHRAQLQDKITPVWVKLVRDMDFKAANFGGARGKFIEEVADVFWSELNEHYRMTN